MLAPATLRITTVVYCQVSTRKRTSAPLSSAHEIAWRHYLRANALLTRALDIVGVPNSG